MSYLLSKMWVVIILVFFIGSSGCVMMPSSIPPANSPQARTNPTQPQLMSSCRQQSTYQPIKQPQSQPRWQPQQQWATQQIPQRPQRHSFLTYWYDPLGLLGSPVPPAIQHSVNIPTVRQPSKPEHSSATTPSNPIALVAHQSPKPPKLRNQSNTITPTIPLTTNHSTAVRPTASPELYQPWNWDAYRVKRSISNPYRLVADTQESVANRNAPPAMNHERLMTLSRQPQTPNSTTVNLTPTNLTTTPEKISLLNLGRDLVKELSPSNDRKWSQNHAVLQTAEWNGDRVTVHNIRYSKYETAEQYTTRYYNATFDLNDIRTIDLVVVPFRGIPRLAHVESSFGFADGRHLGMSIEARYEEGEQYDPLGAGLRQFELIYVFADERDMIRLGTDVNKNDVHIYRLKFEPHEVRAMFVDALQRTNRLAEKPEFYHPLTNSCVTNLIGHINKGRSKAIPREFRTLLPGLMDHYVYDLKLIDTTAKTFQEAKENAKVNWLVEKFGDLEYFSAGIRQNMY
ncbi:MAG: DUF4105 domain-containing protein [Planctomycetaceae bacterium]|jgi:hypothetical protein|nr:DUF4105 domain-containing protein [Planctomycetaceae bacterium]